MPYLTAGDMLRTFPEQELIQLTNLDEPTAESVNLVRLGEAIAQASDLIDSYLNVAIALPLVTVPTILKSAAADIVRYKLDLYGEREDVRRRYEDAIAWLKLVAKGEVSLGLPSPEGNEVQVRYAAPPSVFTVEALDW